jgi:hypothetical protein
MGFEHDNSRIEQAAGHDNSPSNIVERGNSEGNSAGHSNSHEGDSVSHARSVSHTNVVLAVDAETTCNSFMADLAVYAHAHQGRRPDSVQKELHVTEEISESREYRFKGVANNDYSEKINVHRARAVASKPIGVRDYATLRAAFDHVAAAMDGPKSCWKNSDGWFLATIDVLNTDPVVSGAVFQFNTHHFLDEMHLAMAKADDKKSVELLERRSEKDYADLTGYGKTREFKDNFVWLLRN